MKQFATRLDRPILFEGKPLTLTIAISEGIRRAVYFERVYLDASGGQLAIRSALVPLRGLVLLHEMGPLPIGTASVSISLTTENRATESNPVIVVSEDSPLLPVFATYQEQPVLFDREPMTLAIAMGDIRQPVYFERVYLDHNRRQISIASELVQQRNTQLLFNLNADELPLGTRYINACLTNQYRGTNTLETLEYEYLEWNELEYN
ncbi:hypothetical protein OB13_10835 [Pontibacter sp. HJ8]